MRTLLTITATTAALMGAAVVPAVAAPASTEGAVTASSVAGPFSSLTACELTRKKYATAGYRVDRCTKTAKGYVFKYAK